MMKGQDLMMCMQAVQHIMQACAMTAAAYSQLPQTLLPPLR